MDLCLPYALCTALEILFNTLRTIASISYNFSLSLSASLYFSVSLLSLSYQYCYHHYYQHEDQFHQHYHYDHNHQWISLDRVKGQIRATRKTLTVQLMHSNETQTILTLINLFYPRTKKLNAKMILLVVVTHITSLITRNS